MATLRSSTRATPRRKYTDDPFEGIDALLSDSESSSGSETQVEGEQDDDGDDEVGDSSDDIGEIIPNESDDGDSNVGDDLDADTAIVDAGGISSSKRVRRRRKPGLSRLIPPEVVADVELVYTRGLPDSLRPAWKKETQRMYSHGPTKEDYGPVYKAYERWENDHGLPSRNPKHGAGGFAYSDAYEKEIKNSDEDWKWYAEGGGREAFSQRQYYVSLSAQDADDYLPVDGSGERCFVMGAPGRYKFHTLKPRQCVALADSESEAQAEQSTVRNGFVLNLGARVKFLDWVPNQSGEKQYLAVATMPLDHRAPAFMPQPSQKSSILLYQLDKTFSNSIDHQFPPRLVRALCIDFGDIKALKWCPVPSNISTGLGLLAFISGDGALRIIDVERLDDTTVVPSHSFLPQFAFQAKPPDTVCTSLTWINSGRIAAGCANGFVAVWDIAAVMKAPPATNARPTVYTCISSTYITDVTSCWPSYPNLLITSSMDGYLSLTDLSKPFPSSPANTARTDQFRVSQPPHSVWHDFGHLALLRDENTMVKAHSSRRLFDPFTTNKIPSSNMALAASPCHPFVLFGGTNGDVVSCNPLQRLIGGAKVNVTQQTWIQHEWRRPSGEEREAAQNDPAATEDGIRKQAIGRCGLARIVDGWNLTVYNHSNFYGPAANKGNLNGVVFEKETAATALAWNPNVHVGGWAAAGFGDGLLRIEDLGV
ncbi:Transcription factor tau subunit sfc6 [Lecanosticta acicola]|uniref:Transcription factor tau subunit sfc6 n=1 Tax=Lecanosticta acicola TaxID=111012 RepID=A0AAI8YS99_9PEZI|nr:Transcription factor tau subunit sfc6 [Lecanosticta acicola]